MSGALETSKTRILFVDDEEKSRKYFSIIFGRTCEVIVAKDGAEGLEILTSEEGRTIGVIVTDQIMPRMTGIEMLERLGRLRPSIVRVLSTAYTDSDLISGAVRSGLIDYFVGKPWTIDKVAEILDQAMRHHHHLLQRETCS
jgi:DNA-binding NtrC family response regulator